MLAGFWYDIASLATYNDDVSYYYSAISTELI